jgi:3D (Asp-Asp-Asp) domain-containing protein
MVTKARQEQNAYFSRHFSFPQRLIAAVLLVAYPAVFGWPATAIVFLHENYLRSSLRGYLHPSVILAEGRPQPAPRVKLMASTEDALIKPANPITLHGYNYRTLYSGTRLAAPLLPGQRFRILATAYSSTPDQTDSTPFVTASGTRVHKGTVATNILPFGTKIRLPQVDSNRIFVVEDRHHSRLSPRLDIWMETRHQALRFGAKVVEVEIVN